MCEWVKWVMSSQHLLVCPGRAALFCSVPLRFPASEPSIKGPNPRSRAFQPHAQTHRHRHRHYTCSCKLLQIAKQKRQATTKPTDTQTTLDKQTTKTRNHKRSENQLGINLSIPFLIPFYNFPLRSPAARWRMHVRHSAPRRPVRIGSCVASLSAPEPIHAERRRPRDRASRPPGAEPKRKLRMFLRVPQDVRRDTLGCVRAGGPTASFESPLLAPKRDSDGPDRSCGRV